MFNNTDFSPTELMLEFMGVITGMEEFTAKLKQAIFCKTNKVCCKLVQGNSSALEIGMQCIVQFSV